MSNVHKKNNIENTVLFNKYCSFLVFGLFGTLNIKKTYFKWKCKNEYNVLMGNKRVREYVC